MKKFFSLLLIFSFLTCCIGMVPVKTYAASTATTTLTITRFYNGNNKLISTSEDWAKPAAKASEISRKKTSTSKVYEIDSKTGKKTANYYIQDVYTVTYKVK